MGRDGVDLVPQGFVLVPSGAVHLSHLACLPGSWFAGLLKRINTVTTWEQKPRMELLNCDIELFF